MLLSAVSLPDRSWPDEKQGSASRTIVVRVLGSLSKRCRGGPFRGWLFGRLDHAPARGSGRSPPLGQGCGSRVCETKRFWL